MLQYAREKDLLKQRAHGAPRRWNDGMARAEAALTDPERSPSPYRGVFCSIVFFMISPAPRPAVLRGLFSPWGRFGLRVENGALMWLSV